MSLRVAMIEQAVSDFLRTGSDEASSIQHAEKIGERLSITWIFGEEQDYPFSFECLCEVVSCDPDEVRGRVIDKVLSSHDW
jgi:hypothetical protein